MNIPRLSLTLLSALLATACTTLPPAGTSDAAPTRTAAPGPSDTPSKFAPTAIPAGPLQTLSVAPSTASVPAVAPLVAPKDLWERVRRGFAMPELDNPLVSDREQWYTNRPDYIQRMTERGSKYLFHVVEELERRNLPQELALLPFIESAFNPQAVSHAKAAGMWQFMPATGRDFDLKQNAFRDDRRDVLASTRAALDYLERLHRMFGDWHLALAAYNWGEGNVMRAVKRNRAAGLGTGYEDLRMPAETREYVPKLQAVKNIVRAPGQYGVGLPHIGNHPFFDSVPVHRDLDVSLIAQLAGVSEKDFRQLNPSHNKPVVMAAGTPTILLPWDNALLFEERLRQHTGPTASWTAWRVPTHMTAAHAAQQHGLSESELREVNKIPPRMLLRAGSTVLVPRQGQLDRDVPEHIADNGQIQFVPERAAQRTQRVKVRAGDTQAKFAKRHRVSVAELRRWNQLKASTPLRAGQTLLLVREGVAVASADRDKKKTSTLGKNKTKASKVQARAKQKSNTAKAAQKPGTKSTKQAQAGKKTTVASSKTPITAR